MPKRSDPEAHHQPVLPTLALVGLCVGLLSFPLVVRFDLTGAVHRMEYIEARLPFITRLAMTSWAAPAAACACAVCLVLGVRSRAWLWIGVALGATALAGLTAGLFAPL